MIFHSAALFSNSVVGWRRLLAARLSNNIISSSSSFCSKDTNNSNDLIKMKKLQPIRLVLYTKANCELCDVAVDFIEDHYPDVFSIESVDITKNRDLWRKFKLDIPVFYHEGQLLMQHRADPVALESLIKQYQQKIQ